MKTMFAIVITLAAIVSANAQATDTAFVSYRDAVSACGKEWRSSDARKAVEKGKGRDAWNAFRADCVTKQGYVKGRKAPK